MKWILVILTVLLIIAHQDLWFWGQPYLIVFGFLPVGLWYHALFCVTASLLLALFVVSAWPTHLEDAEPETPEARKAEGYSEH